MPRRIRPTTVHASALREARVLRVEDVTPGMRRVTLTGDQLATFALTADTKVPELVSTGFDDDIRVIFPYPGESEPVLPSYVDGKWVAPKDRRPLGRYYTVRRWDPVARELDLDFVKHGVGVAATWAERAQAGDVVHFGGPSASAGLPEGFDWLLVVGDETALPAIGRLLEELPADARAQVFVEVAEASHRQELRELGGVSVTWLSRDGAAAGGSGLLDAVRAAEWWEGGVFAWVAGEQSVVRDVRRHLVEEREVPKPHVDFCGYWKRTEAVALEGDASLPDPEQEDKSSEKFHKQSELLPPLAIRLAVELGLGELILGGVTTPAELAVRTGTVEWALRKFLRYLETIELVASEGDEYRLTDSGEELADAWMIEMLRPSGISARLEQGFFGLGESLRTGRASYASVTGQEYGALREDADFGRRLLDDQAEGADYLAAPLAGSRALQGLGHVVVRSDTAGAIAANLVEQHAGTRVTIVAPPTQAAWLRDDLPQSVADAGRRERVVVVEESEAAAVAPADAVLVVNRLAQHTDAEAVALLRGLADGLTEGGGLLLFDEALDLDELDDHDAEADLLNLTLHGSGYRTDAEIEALVAEAGLAVAASEPVAWGDRLRTLVPAQRHPAL